jgi:hypothetical protein
MTSSKNSRTSSVIFQLMFNAGFEDSIDLSVDPPVHNIVQAEVSMRESDLV